MGLKFFENVARRSIDIGTCLRVQWQLGLYLILSACALLEQNSFFFFEHWRCKVKENYVERSNNCTHRKVQGPKKLCRN